MLHHQKPSYGAATPHVGDKVFIRPAGEPASTIATVTEIFDATDGHHTIVLEAP